jgi:hypothetical protein
MNGAESNKLKPALIAGLAAGAASSIPPLSCLNVCCCALVIGGGFLAVFLWLKDTPRRPEPPYGDAAILGLLTGVFGAFAATVISVPINMLFSGMGWMDMSQLHEALEGANLPPEAVNMIEGFISGGGLTIGAILIGLVFNLVIYAIFALIGALIGVAVLHKKQLGGAAPPPPPVG